ncbi:aldehyde dehydrogenase family protein [Saccharopolyspora sp. ASAGF58]|uniref:aldehyde dehydrogenase family protein n=1 Tax=Saccharopolyspora sp. ASAGF58 TaxID=2719023 RepID=UPI001440221F|nr:aldehyde dehydrogenase family protein [Saccharopolyspora sp. ASAGF58]
MSLTAMHWIDGALFEGHGTRGMPILNPASGTSTGQLRLADGADVDDAVASAAAAFPAWRDTSLARRTSVLFAFRELLNERKGQLAEIITREHGKVLSDAMGEVARGQEVVEFACGAPHLLKGSCTINASTRVDAQSKGAECVVVGLRAGAGGRRTRAPRLRPAAAPGRRPQRPHPLKRTTGPGPLTKALRASQ